MYLRIVTNALTPAERAQAAEHLRQLADLIDPTERQPSGQLAQPDRRATLALTSPTKEKSPSGMEGGAVQERGDPEHRKPVPPISIDVDGRRVCPDGGRCHHSCLGERCWRRETGCVPLSASGLGDDWRPVHETGDDPCAH